MDQINPLAELTHKRRISVFGPNGLKRDHISTVIRDIHPSQYGRLCPIETPEGQNAGLITSMSMYSRIGTLGSLETPYFLMKDGNVFCDKQPIFLNPEQESETIIAFCDINLSKQKKIDLIDDIIKFTSQSLMITAATNASSVVTGSDPQKTNIFLQQIAFLAFIKDKNIPFKSNDFQEKEFSFPKICWKIRYIFIAPCVQESVYEIQRYFV
jgi:DNA-directed RNA polymerase subunit beta